jgi:hypothetical protein
VLRAAALPRAVCRIVSSHVIVQQERKSKKGANENERRQNDSFELPMVIKGRHHETAAIRIRTFFCRGILAGAAEHFSSDVRSRTREAGKT